VVDAAGHTINIMGAFLMHRLSVQNKNNRSPSYSP
jgi:hypothetical protein